MNPSEARGSEPGIPVAVVQMTTGRDTAANVTRAGGLVAEAARRGATLVVLPETWNLMDDADGLRGGAESLDGPSLTAARGWAAAHSVTLLAGSITERIPGSEQTFNTSVLIGPDGRDIATYCKTHLFDVAVGGRVYRESAVTRPGDRVVVADACGQRLGMSVCYDLRFPELYRALIDHGASLIAVPSAFTATTGRDHWEVLLRARAIENQVAVLAANQFGRHDNGTISYGRSMIVDAWGTVLAQVPDGEGIAIAAIDFARQAAVRADLPALTHRRTDLYGSSPHTT